MTFTNEKPVVATKEYCITRWMGGEGNFRCGICGYKFKENDVFRWIYTNDLPGYNGNPLVCEKCDGPDVIERWKKLVDEFNSSKYWYLRFLCGCRY